MKPHATNLPAKGLIARGGVLIIAHRGASGEAPENTLPAFDLALEQGADLVELDTRDSKDGVPIVMHDDVFDRTTDAVSVWGAERQRVIAHSVAELAALDAGSWFEDSFRGTRVPTLKAALERIQPRSMTLIERKAGDAETLLALLEEMDVEDHVVVQAFDWPFLAAMRRRSKSIVLAALGSKVLTAGRLSKIERAGAAVVGWNHKHLDEAAVERVHARGLKLWAYTVDSADRAKELVAWGVDGIITNYPAAIRSALAD